MHRLIAWLVLALITGTSSQAIAAAVVPFTGATPAEGLDFQGNFTYAVNVGPSGAAGKVGDAIFTGDNAAGVVVAAQNNIADWHVADLGDSTDDNNLERVLRSIRWSAAPTTVVVTLAIERGTRYKLQLLFAEDCCPNRGFDVKLDDVLEVDEFNPGGIQIEDGSTLAQRGAAIIHEFTAASEVLKIELDGNGVETPGFTDHNAILNGFTLERLSAVGDLDGDGLADDWEKRHFGDTSATPTADADQDGLSNLREFTLGTLPRNPDSDGDQLTDGAEIDTHHTDPLKLDTDEDTLTDGAEVNSHRTDPTKADSDGDGSGDYAEIVLGTDAADSGSVSKRLHLGAFTGGDPGEGLDLQGTFIAALNIGGPDAGQVGDAVFAAYSDQDAVANLTFEARNQIPNWHAPEYGTTDNDNALELVMQSIRWTPSTDAEFPAIRIAWDNLQAGAEYKVQLLVAEQCCPGRAFDLYLDGALLINEVNPSILQGGPGNTRMGAVIAATFIARSTSATLTLDGRTISTPAFTDHNPILNGFTLEKLTTGPVDSDNDGLFDAWEREFFGDLAQIATGDPDADGIRNSDEFTAATHPARADTDRDGLTDAEEKSAGTQALNPDTDGDGLTDGDEVRTHRSDPLERDSDRDGLTDGNEINIHRTNPAARDTDGDGFEDPIEIFSFTAPNDTTSKPGRLVIAPFTGGDPGEGLDLDGTFRYALNIGGADGGPIRGATFLPASSSDAPEGAEVTAVNEIGAWHAPSYGDTADDDALEYVMQSIRWSAAPDRPSVRLTGLVPGRAYKLQLLFAESCCARGFDVLLNGRNIADDTAPYLIQGGINNQAAGAVVSYSFKAATDIAEVILDGAAAPYSDHNATLSALTLEDLGPAGADFGTPVRFAAPKLTGTSLTLTWSGGDGPFVVEHTANLVTPAWVRVKFTATRSASLPSSAASGFYRIRE